MQITQLLRWVKSPIVSRRRKAIRRLVKNSLRDPTKVDEIFNMVVEGTNDPDESVRITAIKSLVELSLTYQRFLPDVMDTLLKMFEDDSPQVKSVVLNGLTKIISVNKELFNDNVQSIVEVGLNSPDTNVRIAALNSLAIIANFNTDVLLKNLETVLSCMEDPNPLVRRNSIEALLTSVDLLSDADIAKIWNILLSALKDPSCEVRKNALEFLHKLLEKEKMELDDNVINEIRKKLRDDAVPVKSEALALVSKLIDKNSYLADKFLDIISRECLLKEKNLNFKLQVLEFLKESVKKIPSSILNRHNIPRSLDIVEKNTVPKSPKREKIKRLARYILEDLLGYTYEIRKKMWGS